MTHAQFMSRDENQNEAQDKMRVEIVSVMLNSQAEILKNLENLHGFAFARSVLLSFIASVVSTTVYDSLTNPIEDSADPSSPRGSVDERTRQYEAAHKSFRIAKAQIADAVATGFTGGFLNFNPDQVIDYYCEINPIPEPVNRMPA